MSAHLATTLALYALGLGGWAALTALGAPRTPALLASLVLLEAGALVQAGLDLAGLAGGHHPAERATHLGYVAASVLLLPIVLSSASPERVFGRWDAAIACVGCLGMAVVALRLRATWAAAGG